MTAESKAENGGGKIDKRRTPEFREAARARAAAQWTPSACEAQSELIRAKMAAPTVRQKISAGVRAHLADPSVHAAQVARVAITAARPEVREAISRGTRAGIARRRMRQLDGLRQAWAAATDSSVRKQFAAEIAGFQAANLQLEKVVPFGASREQAK
jgi:hypothetical protein